MSDESSPWRTLNSRTLHEGPLFTVRQDETRNEEAGLRPYTWLRFKVVGVTVLPIDDQGCTYLVGQHRYPSGRFTWELVRGAGDLSTPPEESARRELREETGFAAEHWLEAPELMASPGVSDEIAPCFVAWGLSRHEPEPDPQEKLRIRRVPFDGAVDEVLDGRIVDASSAALVLAVQMRLLRGSLPEALSSRLGQRR